METDRKYEARRNMLLPIAEAAADKLTKDALSNAPHLTDDQLCVVWNGEFSLQMQRLSAELEANI